jgi:hypothetical protein
MTRKLKFAIPFTILALGGCTPFTTLPTAVSTAITDVGQVISNAQQDCTKAAPILTTAAGSTNSVVTNLNSYASATCQVIATGQLPSTANSNFPSWLSSVLNGLQTALQLAGELGPAIALF